MGSVALWRRFCSPLSAPQTHSPRSKPPRRSYCYCRGALVETRRARIPQHMEDQKAPFPHFSTGNLQRTRQCPSLKKETGPHLHDITTKWQLYSINTRLPRNKTKALNDNNNTQATLSSVKRGISKANRQMIPLFFLLCEYVIVPVLLALLPTCIDHWHLLFWSHTAKQSANHCVHDEARLWRIDQNSFWVCKKKEKKKKDSPVVFVYTVDLFHKDANEAPVECQ